MSKKTTIEAGKEMERLRLQALGHGLRLVAILTDMVEVCDRAGVSEGDELRAQLKNAADDAVDIRDLLVLGEGFANEER